MREFELENQIDPQKRLYFYLSYAQAEEKSEVQQFFKELSDSIRVRARLPLTEVVGCGNELNANDREEGLRTSRLMIALLSPAYFKDKTTAREWQVFEMRKAKSDSIDTNVIIPIPWYPYSSPVPRVISRTPIFGQNGVDRDEPVGILLRSRGKHREYAEFVNSLANFIVDATASFQLPEMDSIPDDVSNAFEDCVGPQTNSQTNNPMPKQILNQNFLIIDGAFAKSIAEQIKETAQRSTPPFTVDPSAEVTQSKKAANGNFSVFTIDDNPVYVEKIKTTGDFSLEFKVTTYKDPADLLDAVDTCLKEHSEPDLLVINPEMPTATPSRNLLEELLDKKNFSSPILAISGNANLKSVLQSAGIHDLVTILPKPFTSADLLPLMKRWAQVGREKRDRRGRSNLERPVFLSYSSNDEKMATQICRSLELRTIGVWYTLETLNPGDEWRIKVSQGLNQAQVFIALISDTYPTSGFCEAEMGIILNRLQEDAGNLLVIPVLYHPLTTTTLEDPQIKQCRNQHEVKIWDNNWQKGFQDLLRSVQKFLNRPQNQS